MHQMHQSHLANNNSTNFLSCIFSSQSLFSVLPVPVYSIKYSFSILYFTYPYFYLRTCVWGTEIVFVPSRMRLCAAKKIVNSIHQAVHLCVLDGGELSLFRPVFPYVNAISNCFPITCCYTVLNMWSIKVFLVSRLVTVISGNSITVASKSPKSYIKLFISCENIFKMSFMTNAPFCYADWMQSL
jgi:hypothetical protein